MKVAVLNGSSDVFDDPTASRPLGFNKDRFQVIDDPYEANVVYINLDYRRCNEEFEEVRGLREFEDNANKCIFWTMHDSPVCAYTDERPLKFVCQPMSGAEQNRKFRVIPVPLQMRHFEFELIKDKEFVETCRGQEKKFDFVYIGQVRYADRDWLKPERLNVENYLFRETDSIYHVMDLAERVAILKKFCLEVAQARYCFCPRGIGSSSFRLYQSLMVGTVPIVSGMADYPFGEEIDWRSFCVIDDDHSFTIEQWIPDETDLRRQGIAVWEKYFRMENTDRLLFEKHVMRTAQVNKF